MTELRYHRLWQRLGAVMLIVVLVAALLPNMPVLLSDYIDWGDKIEHTLIFAWLMLWYCQLYGARRARPIVAAGLVMFGLLIEVLQGTLTTTRTADPLDLMADSFGVLVGWGLARAGLDGVLVRVETWLFPVRTGD